AATVATALLHDTVEDTLATIEEIDTQFGAEIARLVDGVTKLSKLELHSDRARQAENFRKFLLAMSSDIRVLLVKLADRLHNMRTLSYVRDPARRRRTALETMEIYAPLAERIGMQKLKEDLEDLAFAEINPEARASVMRRLDFLRQRGGDLVGRIAVRLAETLRAGGLDAEVMGREKQPYSIWRKMERKNISFEQLSDIMAFRVILPDVPQCYLALGVAHGAYPMIPGRFKDFISTPKPNNYRAVHTTVIGPERQRIEVQICTREMFDVAEFGVAAHWQYKQHEPTDGSQYRWLRELLEILENAPSVEEFLENTKLEMFQDQVFCFTPKGDLIVLPQGATPIDFAYAVHTNVGDTCVGARVNGRLAPLRTQLQNGDQVEIVRSKAQTPSPTWENIVVTGKARAAIRRFVRSETRTQYHDLGKQILEKTFREAGHEATEAALATALTKLQQRAVPDLFVAVGEGLLSGRQVLDAVHPSDRALGRAGRMLSFVRSRTRFGRTVNEPIPIKGLIPGVALHFAECCYPLPGDRIVGIQTSGKGVTVHTIDCETLETMSDAPERWIDVAWDGDPSRPDLRVGRILAVVANQPGSLSAVTTAIAKHHGNISNLKIASRSVDFFEFLIDIDVQDVKHLTLIIAALRAEPTVASVKRVRG
ncbi:MAG: bifunctional (p)ppGpp synthetase/guanosine-3',5'-bis(diphosphate) 3'-pyrophosphohydrolase, partial [Alphaproteobacteria bacterium]|nr:bifunctional (p)ppGpp synthetase/guanosine-3',5'-bis(diphosphate) 3'-pyrophosphohydrolase [Alphaproteobacteria bacterium]